MFHGEVSPEIARGLIHLRTCIAKAGIPSSCLDETLTVATWNIREFGRRRRTQAAIHYIAEIIGQFDLVAVTELRDNVEDLRRVLQILGPYWRVLFSDFNTDAAGNHERIAFVYDKRAVAWTGLAGEADPEKQKQGDDYVSKLEWWRSPYMASFASGNFDFILLAAHVRYGKSVKRRAAAIGALADWVDGRMGQKHVVDRDFFVLGDFNITSRRSATFKALTKHRLRIPGALMQNRVLKATNVRGTKPYDQIAFDGHYTPEPLAAGVLSFTMEDLELLFPHDEYGLTPEQCTYQLSDHIPLWMQVDTDIDGELLDQQAQPSDP
ncbi:MAG: endonuclease/exonuclease/phosphatase family protein [Thermoplasmatota archaeon]